MAEDATAKWPSVGTRRDLVRRAEALAPALRERAPIADAERRLPDETMRDLAAAGLARVLQPARYGGAEAPFGGLVDVVSAAARACASSGWVLAQYAVHNFMFARWPEQGQDEVWGERPESFLGGVLIPSCGRSEAVAGGYRLTGRWPFASGVHGSDWCMLAAFVDDESGGSAPENRIHMVPKGALEIIDTWHTVGLRGTGSHDVEVAGVFVPTHLTLPIEDTKGAVSPGSQVNTAPLFKLPSYAMFSFVQGSVSLGIAEGALAAYLAQARDRITRVTRKSAADYTTTQVKVAEAAAATDAARTIMHASCDEAMRTVEAGDTPTMLQKTKLRRDGTFAGVLAARAVDLLLQLSGGAALYDSNPLSRCGRDMTSAQAHITQNWDANGATYGRVLLGLPAQDPAL